VCAGIGVRPRPVIALLALEKMNTSLDRLLDFLARHPTQSRAWAAPREQKRYNQ
jgi:hypothetical protein